MFGQVVENLLLSSALVLVWYLSQVEGEPSNPKKMSFERQKPFSALPLVKISESGSSSIKFFLL